MNIIVNLENVNSNGDINIVLPPIIEPKNQNQANQWPMILIGLAVLVLLGGIYVVSYLCYIELWHISQLLLGFSTTLGLIFGAWKLWQWRPEKIPEKDLIER